MKLMEYMTKEGYEQVVFCHDPDIDLKAIIAIHNTTLGPALGGIWVWQYKSEEEALLDVLRLAKAMSLKNAASGLNLGGGKTVVMGPIPREKRAKAQGISTGRAAEQIAEERLKVAHAQGKWS